MRNHIPTLAAMLALSSACGDNNTNNQNNIPGQDMNTLDMGTNNQSDMPEKTDMDSTCESGPIKAGETTADYKARIQKAISEERDICLGYGATAVSQEVKEAVVLQMIGIETGSKLIDASDDLKCEYGDSKDQDLTVAITCTPKDQYFEANTSDPEKITTIIQSNYPEGVDLNTMLWVKFSISDEGLVPKIDFNSNFSLTLGGNTVNTCVLDSKTINCDLDELTQPISDNAILNISHTFPPKDAIPSIYLEYKLQPCNSDLFNLESCVRSVSRKTR